MKKILRKLELLTLSFTMLIFMLSGNFPIFINVFNANAASYRTSYTIYGDLNADERIDVFDVVEMRKKIVLGDNSTELDLNYDGKVDVSDLELLTGYVLGEVYIFDSYFYDDADEDKICDLLEVSLKTNPDSADTDGDTLSDFDEIVYTGTSPANKYTNGLSITDANDDSDGDKLTNKEELAYGTNPLLSDSDFDDISDYDEIKKYMTDPNNDDSDKDNILDGDEVKLGLKPNTDKSNGEILDNQCTFNQNIDISNEILSYINVDDSLYELSIDIVSAGVAEKELSVSVGEFTDFSDNEKIIGKSIALSYNDKLSVDSAKIYFTPRKIEGKISDYMIFEFFPDTNYLLPVETKYTSSSAYVETTELGTFCLVNTKNIMQINSRATGSIVWDYTLGETEVAFFVDMSGCLDENLEETKRSIHDFSQALFEHTENGSVSILGYYSNPTTGDSKIGQYIDSNKNKIFNSIESVDAALNLLSSYTTNKNNDTNAPIYALETLSEGNNLFSSTCPNKYAFIISDSTYSFTNSYGFKLAITNITCNSLEKIYNNNVHLNFVLSSENYNKTTAVSNLKEACEPYKFNIYSKSKTGYFANDTYARIYSDAVIDLKTVPVMYTCSISPNTIPEKVERNAFINSLPKSIDSSKVPASDADGNINFKDAAAKVGAKYRSLYAVCDESDLTRKGYEQFMEQQQKSVSLIAGSVQITPFSDKLLYDDSDGDTIPDIYDPYPDEVFDERFEIINDFNYEPSINFVNERYKNSQECYNTIVSNENDTMLFILIALLSKKNDLSVIDSIISDIMGTAQAPIDFGSNPLRANEEKAMEHAADALLHYFNNSGQPITYNSSEICELLSCSQNYLDHLHRNITRAMKCSEQLLVDNQTICFSSKCDSGFKATCNVDRGIADGGIACDANSDFKDKLYHCFDNNLKSIMCNYVHRDWWNTIGESGAAIVAQTTRSGNTYTMNYTYYVKDIYEWAYHYDKDLMSGIFHTYHEQGLAQEFLMNGQFTGTITWKSGEEAYTKNVSNVRNQIKETLKKSIESKRWLISNEYDRFFAYIDN